MVDELKFGPEWLRALTDGNVITSPPQSPGCLSKYKLAEYRYGREEMLSLFVEDKVIPESMKHFSPIYLEKVQHPLAFVPLSEDEQRLMAQGVNSTAVLRVINKGPTLQRGAKIASERGRGRGRGRIDNLFLFKDSENEPFGRGRAVHSESWEDTRDEKQEKIDFALYYHEDVTSSHRDLSRSFSTDNWRETKRDHGEEMNWRKPISKEKYQVNWRDKEHPLKSDERDIPEHFYKQNKVRNSGSYEEEEALPEWSINEMENDVGTFDASGAFLSLKTMKSTEKCQEVSPEEGHGENKNSSLKIRDKYIEMDNEHFTKHNSSVNECEMLSDDSCIGVIPKMNLNENDEHVTENLEEKVCKNVTQYQSDCDLLSTTYTDKLPETVEKMNKQSDFVQYKDSAISSEEKAHKQDENVEVFYQQTTTSAFVQDSKYSEVTDKKCNQEIYCEISENELLNRSKNGEQYIEENYSSNDKVSLEDQFLSRDIQEENEKWFYRDPQGEMQGPFNAPEMAEWFSAGYFTMNLMVKRGCDEHFFTLGELIKRWGRVPFLPDTNLDECTVNIGSQNQRKTTSDISSNYPPTLIENHMLAQEQLKTYMLQQQQAAFLHQQAIFMRQFQMQHTLQLLQQSENYSSDTKYAEDVHVLQKQQHKELLADPLLPKRSLNVENISVNLPNVTQPSISQKPITHCPVKQDEKIQTCIDTSNKEEEVKRSFSDTVNKDNSIAASIWEALNKSSNQGSWTKSSVWDIKQKEKILSVAEIESVELNQHKESEVPPLSIENNTKMITGIEDRQQQKKESDNDKDSHNAFKQSPIIPEISNKTCEKGIHVKEKFTESQIKNDRNNARKQFERTVQQSEKKDSGKKKAISKEIKNKASNAEGEKKKKVADKITRSQDKQEEFKIQQKETVLRLQQDQLSNIKLPQHAQWATNPYVNSTANSHMPNLQKIQDLEAEEQKQKNDKIREAKEKQEYDFTESTKKTEDKVMLSWAKQNLLHEAPKSKSLVEIQQEQAQQHLQDVQQNQMKNLKPVKNFVANGPVWTGSVNQCVTETSHSSKQAISSGFWEDFSETTLRKKSSDINKHFPSLSTVITTPSQKTKDTKIKKEEEVLQRLFKPDVPSNDFTCWCEEALLSFKTSVDVPTFINFLFEVDSPYEIHDYARQFLGESKKTTEFAKLFIGKREKYKKKSHARQKEGAISAGKSEYGSNAILQSVEDVPIKKGRKPKKNMQRVDNSILGFTCTAATERINVGEIENL